MNIKDTLEAAGLYDQKLDHQIKLTRSLELECGSLRREIKAEGYLIDGPKGKVINPLIASLQKAESLLQSAYTALGLTYSIKPENYKEAKAGKAAELDGIMDL